MSDRRVVLRVHEYYCPVCGVIDAAPGGLQAIFNPDERGVLATFACPACKALVQVYAAGESYARLHVVKKENPT